MLESDADSAELTARRGLLTTLLEPGVATAGRKTSAQYEPPFPEEDALLASASARRKLEFRAGRACARAVMRELGRPEAPLLRGKNGEPLWPSGMVGSITHTETFSAAAASFSERYVGIGIDVEDDGPVSPEFAARVCSKAELARCAELGRTAELARVVFSAKESAYKLQFPLSGRVLYWNELEVLLEESSFSVRFSTPLATLQPTSMLVGRWLRGSGLIFTAVAVKRVER